MGTCWGRGVLPLAPGEARGIVLPFETVYTALVYENAVGMLPHSDQPGGGLADDKKHRLTLVPMVQNLRKMF